MHGRTSPNTEIHGGKVSKWVFQRRKQMLESKLHAREWRGKNAQPLRTIPQGTSAPPATETAIPGSGYTVIQDPAQIPSTNHCLFETRMPLFYIYNKPICLPVKIELFCRVYNKKRKLGHMSCCGCTYQCVESWIIKTKDTF